MKQPLINFMVIMAPFGLLAAPVSDLLPPQKRAETLLLARNLLTTKVVESSEEALAAMDPFNPVQPSSLAGDKDQGAHQAVAMSERDLLKKIADGVLPSGMMQLGDRIILLVGNKKLKVGDRFAVKSEGNAYELEVSAIDRTSFTLRFKNEEITRPITPPIKKP